MIPLVFAATIDDWQMTLGERAAFEGVLSFTRPDLAVEIGTAKGGSLERTAAWSGHVHSFDLTEAGPEARALPNVTFHGGDSHRLLAPWLEVTAGLGMTAGFAHVDGDHDTEGVARDLTDLLESPAFDGVMLIHDTANPGVRAGLDLADFAQFPHVAYVDYDFVPGRLVKRQDIGDDGQLWGGIGLVLVDRSGRFRVNREWASQGIRQDRYYSPGELIGYGR